jgi:hypothetical protein
MPQPWGWTLVFACFDLAKKLVPKFIGGISVSTFEALMRLQAQSMQMDKVASQQLTK